MAEPANVLLPLLRQSVSTRWIADNIAETLEQGVSVRVRDASSDVVFAAETAEPTGITRHERKKRETYETTRPYTESEELEVFAAALRTLLLDLPAIQVAGIQILGDLGA